MPATVALGQRQASPSAYDRAYRLVLKFEESLKVIAPNEAITSGAKCLLLGMIEQEIATGDAQVAEARAATRGALVSMQATMDRVSADLDAFLRPVAAARIGSFDHISIPVDAIVRSLGDRPLGDTPTDRALDDLMAAKGCPRIDRPVAWEDGAPSDVAADDEHRATAVAVELLDDRVALGDRAEMSRVVPRQAAE